MLAVWLPLAISLVAGSVPRQLRPPSKHSPLVVVVKRPGLASYEKVAEELATHLGARLRVLPHGDVEVGFDRWVIRVGADLVIAIGQSAYDALRGFKLPAVLHTYVYHRASSQHYAVPSRPGPSRLLRLLKLARPAAKRIGVLHTKELLAMVNKAQRKAATPLGLTLVSLLANSPADAITALRRSRKIDALWLPTDLGLLSRRVIRYAISLQFRRRLPLLAPGRRHVKWGALMAADYDPEALGKLTACRATALLMHGRAGNCRRGLHVSTSVCSPPRARVTINLIAARHLQLSVSALRAVATDVVQ